MSKGKYRLVEYRSLMTGERYQRFDDGDEPPKGIVLDYEDWGFEPDTANFVAWALKNRNWLERIRASQKKA